MKSPDIWSNDSEGCYKLDLRRFGKKKIAKKRTDEMVYADLALWKNVEGGV
jgi:hypothetical protein